MRPNGIKNLSTCVLSKADAYKNVCAHVFVCTHTQAYAGAAVKEQITEETKEQKNTGWFFFSPTLLNGKCSVYVCVRACARAHAPDVH